MRRSFAFVIAAGALACSVPAQSANNIGAIGQIVPAGGIVDIGGAAGAIVRSINVHTGDAVKAGDLLMTVEDNNLAADRALAATELEHTRKSAAQQVVAQALAVKLAQQRLEQAKRELKNYRAMGADSTSQKELDHLQSALSEAQLSLQIETAKQQIVGAQSATDVQVAERQAKIAAAAEEIRAPIDGTILKANHQIGERLNNEPVISMADLRAMNVVCQVYEGDILKLSTGMKATIKSPALPKTLTGTVQEIGLLIDSHAKLGEVKVRLDHPDMANRLVGLEVEVSIFH